MKLELPTLQSWSCHSCGNCCRDLDVEITDAERQRIAGQNWTADDGVPAEQVQSFGLFKKRYRLAHAEDGACVFLDEDNKCRIHSKFGEAAKPLACRLYPFTFHPGRKGVKVGLRFSCPSVARNDGKPLGERNRELRKLAEETVPPPLIPPLGKGGTEGGFPPPKIDRKQAMEWGDFERFVAALDDAFQDASTPFVIRLLRTVNWMTLVSQSQFGAIRGQRLKEYLELVRQAAEVDVPTDGEFDASPGKLGSLYFRLLVGQYTRKDTFASIGGLFARWRMLRGMWRFTRGKGDLPEMPAGLQAVPFDVLEGDFESPPAETETILTRYFRVKIQSLHFCGPAYYDVPLVEGFFSLALVYPAAMYLSRWLAVSNDRRELQTDDVVRALTMADTHHGFSPLFGSRAFRRRVRHLAESGDVARLCARYGV